MTEVEWLTCHDPRLMLDYLRGTGILTERKARLFAAACCRRIWSLIPKPSYRAIVDVAERFADGQADWDEMEEAVRLACERDGPPDRNHALWAAIHTTGDCVVLWPYYDPEDTSYSHAANALAIEVGEGEGLLYQSEWPSPGDRPGYPPYRIPVAMKEEYVAQTALLRDMYGNPFRPKGILSSLISPKAVQVAQAIYNVRAFHRMPELAAILEDRDKASEVVLMHCRSDLEHVRGCWLLDALLCKN